MSEELADPWTVGRLLDAFDAEEGGRRGRMLYVPQWMDRMSFEEAAALTPHEVWDRFAHLPEAERVEGSDLERYEVRNEPEGRLVVWRLPFRSTDPFAV